MKRIVVLGGFLYSALGNDLRSETPSRAKMLIPQNARPESGNLPLNCPDSLKLAARQIRESCCTRDSTFPLLVRRTLDRRPVGKRIETFK